MIDPMSGVVDLDRPWPGWQPIFLIRKSMKSSDDRKTMPQRSAFQDFTG